LARCLIIGCGCRGRLLARELAARGHAVRGTSRDPERLADIQASGAEPVLADPDRVGSLVGALDHVSVALILLGSAQGDAEALADLHGPRLQMLLTKLVDTTVHGVVYEARGTVGPSLLQAGAANVLAFRERSRARVSLLEADPGLPETWLQAALGAVEAVLAPG
jgi:putative NADH-flavin reductase